MCSVCSVELVARGNCEDNRSMSASAKRKLCWFGKGGDPAGGERSDSYFARWRAFDITSSQQTNTSFFELGMPRPKYAVRGVFLSDQGAGERATCGRARGGAPFVARRAGGDCRRFGCTCKPRERSVVEFWCSDGRWFWSGGRYCTPLICSRHACVKIESACGVKDGGNVAGGESSEIRLSVPPAAEAASREIIREVRRSDSARLSDRASGLRSSYN